MKLNRKWFLVIALVLSLTMATAGTLAYLTDRDSEANVFTVGNVEIDLTEDFEQGATLIPGVNINKKPVVENIGNNDAWVWAEIAIPSELNSTATASKNVIHFNMSAESVDDGKWNWWDGADYSEGAYMIKKKTINEVAYDVYVVQYETALKPGDVTEEVIYNVYLDPHVDIDTDGNWAWVEGGVVTPINWNSKTNGDPVIYVSAYAMQTEGFTTVYDAYDAYQTQWGNNGTEWGDPSAALADTWDGTADTSWYNDTDNEFVITTPEQLAGFAKLVDGGNTFAGKTVKLGKDIDLYYMPDGASEPKSFDPIGYGYDIVFKGTFDGQDHTIKNLYQNGWELGYDYSTAGGGLFASVVDASFKDLTIDKANIVMECIDMGILAGYSYGNSTYENILVKNSSIANYQRYTGGVVGEVNGKQTFKNVDVVDTVVSSLWGDFDCSLGGIIGGKWGDATVTMENCDVACELNAYNDVTSAYQWYAYRRAGMLIGNSEETQTSEGGRTSATASYLTAKNCTVTYGDWVNYTYCEFAGTGYPYVRVQGSTIGQSAAYSNPRYGVATDANGNKVVDDSHVHNDGEDHNMLLTFDQLYGGGQGVYGTPAHAGVTVNYNN